MGTDADFVIVGSGIAGLRAALELGAARTLVLTKDAVSESATQYAQGGIAAAMGEDDAVGLHEQDTLAAGDGLCAPEAVKVLVEEGPEAIAELLAWGANFDRIGAALERTREAAHSRSRILHAHGDSTGREIAETLARRVGASATVELRPHCLATRLLIEGERVAGVEYLDLARGEFRQAGCRGVLLASGGLGQIYSDTTNPSVATGDGAALALAAGAALADMEFVQFHPTALAFPGAPRFLLSEALRGEGAVLRNPAGEQFMDRYHAAAEMAPRDVVARAIESELRGFAHAPGRRAPTRVSRTCFIDATHLQAAELERRFPRIAATLKQLGLNLATDWIPVRPAAHYAMGGVATDLEGRSTVAGLYAAGETACTGVHGANRLASNSLLEGLVFGRRAGRAMASTGASTGAAMGAGGVAAGGGEREAEPAHYGAEQAAIATLRRLMWEQAGVMRHADGLRHAFAELQRLAAEMAEPAARHRAGVTWRHMKATAETVLLAALARQESRGAHFRSDFPSPDPQLAGAHSRQQRGGPVEFGPLPSEPAGR